ncbi:MAG: hypothetical protein KTR14_01285 [Vampirovibrio sp.]|nr:hypothetical protein [Vampirovibrio sp.]
MRLTRRTKLFLMFGPLAVAFLIVLVVIGDLKNPLVAEDSCQVVATGKQARPYQAHSKMLYAHTNSEIYNIGFNCQQQGLVMVNDYAPFRAAAIGEGQQAMLTRKQYQFLPDGWRMRVHAKPENLFNNGVPLGPDGGVSR